MTDTRKWSAAAVVLIVAIFAAGWFLLVSPKRSDASELKAQTATQESANVALQQKLEELKAQQADLPKQRARLAAIETKIPDNPALPSLIRDLTAASRKVGVAIDTMSPSVPVAVSATPGVVTAAPAASAGSTAGTGAAATPASAPAPALYQVPLTLNVTGSYFELEQFVNKLEGLKRSLLVTGFTVTPKVTDEAPDDLTLALTGRVFLSQDAAPAANVTPVTTPVAPATSN
jgi:type IV pilus assembly protein PilO